MGSKKIETPFPPGAALVAYLRDSGGAEQESSIEQQEQIVRAWCAAQGYRLTRLFIDEAISGSTSARREQFLEMIAYFHNGASEAGVVVWKFSRFARNLDDAQFYRADLRRRGYQVYSLNDTIPSGPEGRFFEAAIDWLNERYLTDLSSDVQRGLEHLRKTYRCLGGQVPFGYMRKPVQIGQHRNGSPRLASRWIVDPQQAPLVRRVFDMRLRGETLKTIHQALHIHNSLDAYRYMLHNPIYLGHLRINGGLDENFTEPIIDAETWRQVQHIRERGPWAHPRRRNSPFLLSGIVRCGVCDHYLVGLTYKHKQVKYRYYRCVHSGDGTPLTIPQAALEKVVLATVDEIIADPDYLTASYAGYLQTLSQPPNDADRQALNTELQTIAGELERIVAAIRDAGHSPALLAELKDLEARQAELKMRRAQNAAYKAPHTPAEYQQQLTASSQTLTASDPAALRTSLINLIQSLIVQRQDKTLYGQIALFVSLGGTSPGNL